MSIKPLEIRRTGPGGISIIWPDKIESHIDSEKLRLNCPCAECKMRRGEDTHSSPLTPKKSLLTIIEHAKDEEIRLEAVWGVGQYAIGIRWGDGHETGIYTFQLLKELS